MDSNNGSDDEFSDAVDYTMAPSKLECPIQDCTGGTDGEKWSCEAEPTVAVALLQVHGYSHQQTPAAAAPDTRKPRPRPLPPPKLEAQCSESRFAEWKVEWDFFKRTVDFLQSRRKDNRYECGTERYMVNPDGEHSSSARPAKRLFHRNKKQKQ